MRCRHDPVVVVGGGNSAGQASLFLATYAAQVRLLYRDCDLGKNMSRYLVDAVERSPAILVTPHTEVRELIGEEVLERVVIEDNQTGQRETIDARALFVFIGAEPHTAWLEDQVQLDEHGFVLTGSGVDGTARWPTVASGATVPFLETSRSGVFAVGDVRSGSVKRVAAAAGEGAMAVRLVHEYLSSTGEGSSSGEGAAVPVEQRSA